jgi:thioredoxin-dependent peroxiredoxin
VKFGGFGAKPKVLFFYPKAATPGCTLEAKAFRDSYAQMKKLGVDVYGISNDSPEDQKSFCEANELPYTLLCDENDKVRSMYGVPKDLFGLLPGRQTYVINGKDGNVELVFNNQFKPEQHVEEVLKVLNN